MSQTKSEGEREREATSPHHFHSRRQSRNYLNNKSIFVNKATEIFFLWNVFFSLKNVPRISHAYITHIPTIYYPNAKSISKKQEKWGSENVVLRRRHINIGIMIFALLKSWWRYDILYICNLNRRNHLPPPARKKREESTE